MTNGISFDIIVERFEGAVMNRAKSESYSKKFFEKNKKTFKKGIDKPEKVW